MAGNPAKTAIVVPEATIPTARPCRLRSVTTSLAAVKQFAISAPAAIPIRIRPSTITGKLGASAETSTAAISRPSSARSHVRREYRPIQGADASAEIVATMPLIVASCPTALSDTPKSSAIAVSNGLSDTERLTYANVVNAIDQMMSSTRPGVSDPSPVPCVIRTGALLAVPPDSQASCVRPERVEVYGHHLL